MSVPSNMLATPQEAVTVAVGYTTDTAAEVWQRVAGNVFKVYEQVPLALAQNIRQSADPDTAIKTQLVGYPVRIAAV